MDFDLFCCLQMVTCEYFAKLKVNLQSSSPPFTSIELDHSDSGREGCTVTTLTVTAEPKSWQGAIKVATNEVNVFCLIRENCYCC